MCLNSTVAILSRLTAADGCESGRAVARQHKIAVAGTAAVINQVRIQQLIPSVRDALERLLQSDFRIVPEVIRTVLRQFAED